MKKLFSIIALMLYILSINTLVHASTMGIFSHANNEMEMGHCQTHQQSSTDKTQNINCCELAFSSEYSNTQIQVEYVQHLTNNIPTLNYLVKDPYKPSTYKQYIAWSPGRNTNIKYNKFSDLFGIIVQLS